MNAIARPSIATLRMAERVWLAGRATQLGAHEIPGVVWWRLTDDVDPRGAVLLEVWGPDRVTAWSMLEASRPAGVLVVLRVHPTNLYRRALRWCASRWWRAVLQPIRLWRRGRA